MKTWTVIGSLALLAPFSSQAQVGVGPLTPVAPPQVAVPEPRLPDNPTSPTDFDPSMGVPTPSAGAAEGEAPSAPAPVTGYEGGDYIISDSDPSLWGGVRAQAQGKIPPYHAVVKGDTLWNISNRYYGDPWAWPQLWAHNRTITNPHWIYPGDRVRLMGAAETSAPTAATGETENLRVARMASEEEAAILLNQNGFADPTEMASSGTVDGSPQERLLLSTRDEIFLETKEGFKPEVGKSYTIYRVRKKLKSAKGDELGYLVEIRGSAEVKRTPPGKMATAVITESLAAIERGDRVGPLRRRYKPLPVVRATKDVEATVIDALNDTIQHAEMELVFVDTGREQGVTEGNRFLVLQQGDGYKRLIQDVDDPDPKWPKGAVAEISVLDARDRVSVGVITRAVKEVKIGAPVSTRRGY